MRKTLAFTLAETLIVMGIIGVVSALTLPNLNSSTGEKEKIAKVKKLYSNFNDALGRATAVYGPLNEWCTNYTGDCLVRIGDRVIEFLKVSKNCKRNMGCYTNGSGASMYYEFILADGTAVAMNSLEIMIDVDGLNKGKNTLSYDRFNFTYGDAGNDIIKAPAMTESNFNALLNGNPQYYPGIAANWILLYDNMDYLKADSNKKCPNGTTLTYDTVTTCK